MDIAALNNMESWVFNDISMDYGVELCRILWCRMSNGGTGVVTPTPPAQIETLQLIRDWKWGDELLNCSKRWKMGMHWFYYPTTWGVFSGDSVMMTICIPLSLQADSYKHNLVTGATMERVQYSIFTPIYSFVIM